MTRADIKRLGRPLVAALAHYGGYCALAGRLRGARAGRILSYHGISVRPANPYAVSSDDFARQMHYLADQFVPISVDELVLRLRGGEPLPERSVALTIDDGYADIYANAYPILAQYAIPATIFLPVDFIGTNGSADATARMSQTDFLAWDQIREMSRNGISFGSHTMGHLSLTRLTRREVQHQLERSRATIEDRDRQGRDRVCVSVWHRPRFQFRGRLGRCAGGLPVGRDRRERGHHVQVRLVCPQTNEDRKR